MGLFFVYIIKVAFFQTIFYLTYKLLLSRYSFHAFNRCVLLTMQLSSLLLPVVSAMLSSTIPVHHTITLAATDVAHTVQMPDVSDKGSSFVGMLFIVWICGVVLLFMHSVVTMFRLAMIIRSGKKRVKYGHEIIVVNCIRQSFSFFNQIVINADDYASESRAIIIHELSHARRYHSIDVVLSNIIIMFCWFSPASWLLRAELRNIHEYEADNVVLRNGIDATAYQFLLIRKAVGERMFAMVNNLNQTCLKKRIIMMKKKKSNPWNRAKAAAVLPLAAVSVFVLAMPVSTDTAIELARESNVFFLRHIVNDSLPKVEKPATAKTAATGKATVASSKPIFLSTTQVSAENIPDNMLVIIDGREADKKAIERIDAKAISSVEIIKDDKGVTLYGDKAKSGVIIINLKKSGKALAVSQAKSEALEIRGKVKRIGTAEKLSTAGKVNKVTITTSNGNISTAGTTDETVFVVDGKTVDSKTVNALSPNKIASVTVDKRSPGKKRVIISLKKGTSGN